MRLSLTEFLKTGKFGPLNPSRLFSPENISEVFGKPDEIYVCPIEGGESSTFPIVASYGTVEFHFDSPSTLLYIFHDNPFVKYPVGGGKIKFTDTLLLRCKITEREFFTLSKSMGLQTKFVRRHSDGLIATTTGGVEVGFEFDEPGLEATLRWFSLDMRKAAHNA